MAQRMAHIFALSDIHGNINLLNSRLAQLDEAFRIFTPSSSDNPSADTSSISPSSTAPHNTLVVCGDLIDGEPHSAQVIERLRALQKSPDLKVVVLKGNHEVWFLEFLDGEHDGWFADPFARQTYYSFFPQLNRTKFEALPEETQAELARADFHTEKPDVVVWLKDLPLYYETEKQIFVHAGIDEAAGDLWRIGTGETTFTFKGFVDYGPFLKDVVAGHLNVKFVSGDPTFDGVYWDGASHFYLDGSGNSSLPILIYNEETDRYSQLWDDGSVEPIT